LFAIALIRVDDVVVWKAGLAVVRRGQVVESAHDDSRPTGEQAMAKGAMRRIQMIVVVTMRAGDGRFMKVGGLMRKKESR
jgi:hypothetical protein